MRVQFDDNIAQNAAPSDSPTIPRIIPKIWVASATANYIEYNITLADKVEGKPNRKICISRRVGEGTVRIRQRIYGARGCKSAVIPVCFGHRSGSHKFASFVFSQKLLA